MTSASAALVAAAAASVGGMINAIAGGGSLVTFPTLLAIGMPSVEASFTNTIALCPGWFAAVYAQRRDLVGQRPRALRILPAAAIGGVAGAWLLLATGERAFTVIVPFLILFAAAVLAASDRLRALVGRGAPATIRWWAAPLIAVGGVYAGYFGAALGVIFLAVLAVLVDDTLVRVNALKQTVSLTCNGAAAVFFLASRPIEWSIVSAMAGGALIGGWVGGKLARHIPAGVLRGIVIVIAIAVAIGYLV